MKKLSFLVPLGALFLTTGFAGAQSSLAGTWKVDMNKVDFSKKPDVYVVQGGMYECKTCTPPVKVKADGTDQAVSGIPYLDTMAIKIVSDHELQETDKKGGKVVGTSTTKMSADGKMVMFSFTDSSNTNGGPPVTGKGEAVRVAPGPAGSNPILSGSFRTTKMEGLSDNAIKWTYRLNGDEITMTNPTGQSYTAKLGGSDAPMKGDPGVTSVSVKMLDKNTFEETDKRDGEVLSVFKLVVAADGKTAKASAYDKRSDRTTDFDAVKQ